MSRRRPVAWEEGIEGAAAPVLALVIGRALLAGPAMGQAAAGDSAGGP